MELCLGEFESAKGAAHCRTDLLTIFLREVDSRIFDRHVRGCDREMSVAVESPDSLLKARELQPDNLDVRLKLGMFFAMAGNVKEAQEQASYVLERRPKDEEVSRAWSTPGST